MSKTIVFGGSGLLGETILQKYPNLISVGRTIPKNFKKHIPIKDTSDLSILDGMEFDSVIFLIGNSNHHLINTAELNGIDYNVKPLFEALTYMKTRNLKKFICLTSILLYGTEPKGRAVNEQDEIFPLQKGNAYLFSKYLAEQVVEFFKDDVPVINIRMSNVYGATDLIRPDLIPTLVLDSITKENPTVWNKTPVRDFIFAEDAAEAMLALIETDYTGNVNLGSGTMSSVGDVCDILEKLSGKKIDSLNIPVSGVMKFQTDISLLKNLTGWLPKHNLVEGLTKSFGIMKKSLLLKNEIADKTSN